MCEKTIQLRRTKYFGPDGAFSFDRDVFGATEKPPALAGGVVTQYPIIPIAKPRMSNRDRWLKPPRPPVKRYWDFCLQCKLEKVVLPCFGAHVIFVLPMPESWSKKRKLQYDGKPHMQRPDLSNIIKALEDSIYKEDSVIYDLWATKVWGITGKILIEDSSERIPPTLAGGK